MLGLQVCTTLSRSTGDIFSQAAFASQILGQWPVISSASVFWEGLWIFVTIPASSLVTLLWQTQDEM